MRFWRAVVIFGCLLTLAAPAAAQRDNVPSVLLDNTRRVEGNVIHVCIDKSSLGADLDRAVAQAIADALFLRVEFHGAPTGFPLSGDGYLEELRIVMSNTCDVLAGVSVQPNSSFPDWATVTRPYASVPFILVVKDLSYHSLADIPHDRIIGTALGSIGEQVFLMYQLQQPEERRWRRLPYADPELMLRRLRDGRLDGMLLWQPAMRKLVDGQPEDEGLFIIPTAPVPASEARVGALVSARDSFLRSQIDKAIDALVADGTIARLMKEHGFSGHAGD